MPKPVWKTEIPDLPPPKRGKVRDVYDLGELLLIVACDRISAYDHILQPGIPGKGKILTQLSNFWFQKFQAAVPNHLVATEVGDYPAGLAAYSEMLDGRSVLVKKAAVVPFECVARGYLAGSGFREYTDSRSVCGIRLPEGLQRADKLPEAIFTPATKAESGHDENVSYEIMAAGVGDELATQLREITLAVYSMGADHSASCGLILADTKFEYGHSAGQLTLIDEVLTPDSSRFWEADSWTPGVEPVSFDKQYVRNWLDDSGWDRNSEPPELPQDVVQGTLDRYLEAFRRLTGREPVL
jgi:phosphoribosylaminoimidazole-succinocarboxamide synthase